MSEPNDGEFDLSSLNDEELAEQVHDDLYNGLKSEVEEATRIFLKRGWSAERVLNDALVEGMRIVGIDFRDGILFVPEVLLAAKFRSPGFCLTNSTTSLTVAAGLSAAVRRAGAVSPSNPIGTKSAFGLYGSVLWM